MLMARRKTVETIAAAGNTLVPAYLALRQKGYRVHRDPPRRGCPELWYAEAGARRFVAEDPVTLLGLVALWETRGDNWQAGDAEIDDFMKRFP